MMMRREYRGSFVGLDADMKDDGIKNLELLHEGVDDLSTLHTNDENTWAMVLLRGYLSDEAGNHAEFMDEVIITASYFCCDMLLVAAGAEDTGTSGVAAL